jgi:hypothetical protein
MANATFCVGLERCRSGEPLSAYFAFHPQHAKRRRRKPSSSNLVPHVMKLVNDAIRAADPRCGSGRRPPNLQASYCLHDRSPGSRLRVVSTGRLYVCSPPNSKKHFYYSFPPPIHAVLVGGAAPPVIRNRKESLARKWALSRHNISSGLYRVVGDDGATGILEQAHHTAIRFLSRCEQRQ